MSIVIVMPLKTELAQLFNLNSLKLIGQPFFKISFMFFPFSSITILECERSVTAKFLSSHFFLILFKIFSLFDTTIQLFGAFQRILVSLFEFENIASSGNFKSFKSIEEIFTSAGRMKDFPKLSIVQYLGDAMGDFYSSDYYRFGMDQFIFPNPMYGKW